jgi:hypothetical protein
VADIGRKTRREAAHGAKADKPKRYEPRHRLQDPQANRRTFAAAADVIRYDLRSLCWARMLVRRVERQMPRRRGEANMNSIAATLMIPERTRSISCLVMTPSGARASTLPRLPTQRILTQEPKE